MTQKELDELTDNKVVNLVLVYCHGLAAGVMILLLIIIMVYWLWK